MTLILYTSVSASVCMLSMSFTLNIVNIHRTILHVLALHLGRGRNLVYFTRTSRKKGETGEEVVGESDLTLNCVSVWLKAQF